MSGLNWVLAVMVLQFGVHAAGWTLAAGLQRRYRGPELHFALFWAGLAAGLALYLLPLGSPWRAFGDSLYVMALVVVHRGLRCFHRLPLPDRHYLLLCLLVLGVQCAAVLGLAEARWFELTTSLLCALLALAIAGLLWRHAGREAMRWPVLAVAVLLAGAAAAMGWDMLSTLRPGGPAALVAQADDATNRALGLGLFLAGGLFNLVQVQMVLGGYFRLLVHQSRHDDLTGLANRRGFLQLLEREHERARREGTRYALLMVDVDHFKRINDEHGHATGDTVLAEVAARLAASARAIDSVGRLGGEEFCLLLPATDAAGAQHLAQRVCEAVHASPVLPDWPALHVSVSVGVACLAADDSGADPVLRRADAALYRAKAEGRNRAVMDVAAS
ncbi:MAG: GGDEF domain-containing protein [Burkholderiales bacterium]|nr:GGDEF domain-containing protein [Burkholderiales bacterium]